MAGEPKDNGTGAALTAREREWIDWILPSERAGYNRYREMLGSMKVIGVGRRGPGEMIMGHEGSEIDISVPLPPVLAYGAIETNFGTISVTIREPLDDQISVEIVNQRSDEIPEEFEEAKRWTYSTWLPGMACPQCGKPVREVAIRMVNDPRPHHVLAVCADNGRLWLYAEPDQINHLIPVTNFYNELMLHRNIRDPRIALDSKKLFSELASFSDDDLTRAFITYNALKTKVHFTGPVAAGSSEKPGFVTKLKKLLHGASR
jgi:hypothetical protein